MLTRLSLSWLALALVSWAALADTPPAPADLDLSQVLAAAKGAMSAGGEKEAKPFPDFKDVTKDMESKEGLFTLWYYPPSAKDQDQEKLLCQIPSGFLGENFMLSTSFSGGGFLTGFPLDEHVVRWELLGKQLLLMEPETRFVVDKSKEVADVVRRTYPDRIRAAVPLVTKSPSGDPVIDLGNLLKSNFANIGWMSSFFMGDMGGGGINRELSKWIKKKTFPLNVEIGVELAVSRPYPSGSYDKKLVHYSFWKLPHSDYTPRIADDRVGYFLTANQDWSKPTDSRDIFNRYIDRWHLEKRDPSLPMCEPKKPIIFYIEKTVPVRFRHAVRDGILEWNKAYEKCGFLNAVEVRQQTDDPESGWANLDPEDMRYSFFRWIVTGFGFAMGPHRGNPFTGEIYDADIIFDDSMVRYFEQSAQQSLPSAAMALKMRDPTLQDFFAKFPQWKRPTRDWEGILYGSSEEQDFREALRAHLSHSEHPCCDYAEGMKHQMALANAVLAGQPPEVIDRFLYDVVKEVVMHEVGHTLGLRHNFKASTVYSIEEIQKRRATGQATVGSVMDYNPALFFAKNATDGHFITPTIGPYDYWAIEYGYRPYDGNYKSHKAKKADEEEEGEEEQEGEEASEEPAAEESASVEVALENIPPEVLEQLPPEVKKMLDSGKLAEVMKAHGHAPSKGPAGPPTAKPVAGEEAMLREIASRATEPELVYGTDEDATFVGPDPRIVRFDMGSDPVEWAETRFELINQRMANILDWAVKDEESWYHLRRAFLNLLAEKTFVMDYVGRYIGGEYFNRAHRGDDNSEPPFVLVDAKTQRDALEFIEKNLFTDEFFQFSPDMLNHLAPSRWRHTDSYVSYTMDFPIHDIIGILQWWNLFDRLFPNTLRRIHDNELKTDEADKLTVAEYIQRVQTACWDDTCDAKRAKGGRWTDAKPFVSDIRRSLQREYLGMMEPLVRIPPGAVLSADIHAMLRHSLRQLADQINAVLDSGAVDFASAAHLQECKSRIDRMLTSELREYD